MLTIALACNCFWRVSDTQRSVCISAVPGRRSSLMADRRDSRSTTGNRRRAGRPPAGAKTGEKVKDYPAVKHPRAAGDEGTLERRQRGDWPGPVAGDRRGDQLLRPRFAAAGPRVGRRPERTPGALQRLIGAPWHLVSANLCHTGMTLTENVSGSRPERLRKSLNQHTLTACSSGTTSALLGAEECFLS